MKADNFNIEALLRMARCYVASKLGDEVEVPDALA